MASVIGAISGAMSTPSFDNTDVTSSGLRGKRICTYSYYAAELFQYNPILLPKEGVELIGDCFGKLIAGTVDAVVYDKPILQASKLVIDDLKDFSVGDEELSSFNLAPGISQNSSVDSHMRWAMMTLLSDSDSINGMNSRWFDTKNEQQSTAEEANPALMGSAFTLLGAFTLLQLVPTMLHQKIPGSEFLFGLKADGDPGESDSDSCPTPEFGASSAPDGVQMNKIANPVVTVMHRGEFETRPLNKGAQSEIGVVHSHTRS